MAKKRSAKKPDTTMAFIATFFSVIGFLIALFTRREDKYVMFYAKQSLILFIASVIISIASSLPFLGGFISVVGGILVFLAWIVLWIYALSGKRKEIPVIAEIAEKIRL